MSTQLAVRNLGALIPNCVSYDPFQVETLADVIYVLQHEIDCFDEGQDGALDSSEIRVVRKALVRARRREL
jgi:hypothetical protein